jgi:hypothetical protein
MFQKIYKKYYNHLKINNVQAMKIYSKYNLKSLNLVHIIIYKKSTKDNQL